VVFASVTVALSNVIGLSVFVRAISAIKLTMQMATARFISLKNTPLKRLTVAFSNERPPHNQAIWIRTCACVTDRCRQ